MSPELDLRVPRQRRAMRTRASLLDAARREFSERGHAGATSKTIAERAGVSVGSLYQYFSDKDQILREIARARAELIAGETLGALGRSLAGAEGDDPVSDVRQKLRAVVQVVVDQHRDDPGLHAVLTERRHADPALDSLTSAFERRLIEAGALLLESWGHEGDCLGTAFVVFTMIEGAVHTHVLGEAVVSDERLFDSLLDALVRVVLPTAKGT